jgi:mono/diheme cytochrome c family protein
MNTKILAIFICAGYLWFASSSLCARAAAEANLLTNPVYEKNCAKCHGKTAEGRHFGGPSLISGKTKTMSADELRDLINNGKGRMPKYSSKLSSEEINQLVEQIRRMNQR